MVFLPHSQLSILPRLIIQSEEITQVLDFYFSLMPLTLGALIFSLESLLHGSSGKEKDKTHPSMFLLLAELVENGI